MNSKQSDIRRSIEIIAPRSDGEPEDLHLTCRCNAVERPAELNRRTLLKSTALGLSAACTGGGLSAGNLVVAEEGQDFESLVPSDKGLDPAWVQSLVERGQPEVWSGWEKQLKYIGMPVGGICCGQLYLGGDGRLWLWDIFKSNYGKEDNKGRLDAMTTGGHYRKPIAFGEIYNPLNGAAVDQGFAIRIRQNDHTVIRTLDHQGFPGVEFRGEYPIGKVNYTDESLLVEVKLEAFSPFIPLDAESSALPATVMSYAVSNTSDQSLEVDVAGWLQNATATYAAADSPGRRRNEIVNTNGRISLLSTVEPMPDAPEVELQHGFGSIALSLLHDAQQVNATACAALQGELKAKRVFEQLDLLDQDTVTRPLGQKLLGALGASLKLEPGESKIVDFAITWYFPDYQEVDAAPGDMGKIINFKNLRRHYAPWFNSADEVAQRLVDDREKLINGTREWNRTWYDSTLPYWLLDRTFISIDCLATHTCHWFDSGRFWAWEGVDCCHGTCQHVWHYAQALGRIFPEIERDLRTRVDFGIAQHPDGSTGHRGPDSGGARDNTIAHDGHCGRILGAYREHLTSTDDTYLRSIYPKVKLAMEYVIGEDQDRDGLLEGDQRNTLDAVWSGPMAWISSLYLAALTAVEAMANHVGDTDFSLVCRTLIDKGYKNIVQKLYNGEYFIHKPTNLRHISSNKGCHADQLLGQAWIHQVGLGRVVPKEQAVSALRSLWTYNFSPDALAYAVKNRDIEQAFRWYAMSGEAGLLLCTWPKGGALEAIPGQKLRPRRNPDYWTGPGGYFNEVWTGIEYQVAAHMIYEGDVGDDLVEHGLAITRAVHDRHLPEKRNPYNEIECSDHYARAMSSYGVFLAVCGFEYDGPAGHIGFAPRLTPEAFKAPFTAAEGWGTYEQSIFNKQIRASYQVRFGQIALSSIRLRTYEGVNNKKVKLNVDDKPVTCQIDPENKSVRLSFDRIEAAQGQSFRVVIG